MLESFDRIFFDKWEVLNDIPSQFTKKIEFGIIWRYLVSFIQNLTQVTFDLNLETPFRTLYQIFRLTLTEPGF